MDENLSIPKDVDMSPQSLQTEIRQNLPQDETMFPQTDLNTLSNVVSSFFASITSETSDLLKYGTRSKRFYYFFDVASIKIAFLTISRNPDIPYKLWNSVKDVSGNLMCVLSADLSSAYIRTIWEQSALEFKCRDTHFLEKCREVLANSTTSEKKEFIEAINIQKRLYENEKKYAQRDFFEELYNHLKN